MPRYCIKKKRFLILSVCTTRDISILRSTPVSLVRVVIAGCFCHFLGKKKVMVVDCICLFPIITSVWGLVTVLSCKYEKGSKNSVAFLPSEQNCSF